MFTDGRKSKAALMRAGRFIEEIETMGSSEKRELQSRLTLLLAYLLKWQCQPLRRGSLQALLRQTKSPLNKRGLRLNRDTLPTYSLADFLRFP